MTESAPLRLKLVGEQQPGSDWWSLESFGILFGRLGNEVKHKGDLCRHIGFEGISNGQRCVRFFGVEVDRIEDIPDGMVAWDIIGDEWTVLRQVNGQNIVLAQEKLAWRWISRSSNGRIVGEFDSTCCDFHITANAYFAQNENLEDDVFLVDYDPSWPQHYAETERWLREALGPDIALHIEHYGSTSIPGMPAKPIIDILVEIPSFAEARKIALPLFNKPECEYWWYSDHMCFVIRKKLMGHRTHHIHMAPAGHKIWEGIAFRDHLRAYPEDAARYAALKYELAEQFQANRESYTDAKGAFVQEVTAKASASKH